MPFTSTAKKTLLGSDFHFFFNFQFSKIARKFLKTEKLSNNTLMMRFLPEAEKMEFVSKSVSWIQGQENMDNCFILNFGYEPPHNWPQV